METIKNNSSLLSRLLCLLFILLVVSGCANVGCCLSFSSEDENLSRHLIIGIGVITISRPQHNTAAQVLKMNSLGVSYSSAPLSKFNVGYAEIHSIEIPEGAEDVRVEVNSDTKGIVIDTQCAHLRNAPLQGDCND